MPGNSAGKSREHAGSSVEARIAEDGGEAEVAQLRETTPRETVTLMACMMRAASAREL